MKYLILILAFFSCQKNTDIIVDTKLLKDGDIIFQTSQSQQSKAIQLATQSKYSHCGIIYSEGDSYYVFEAIQPVQKTPLQQWINRGKNKEYVVKRLKNANDILTPKTLIAMKNAGKSYVGKNYDLYFEWSNDRIYCSELIWKIYKEGTGIEIGNLQKLSDFDLTNPIVSQKIKERYGSKIPKNEKVISPAAIYNSRLLYAVIE